MKRKIIILGICMMLAIPVLNAAAALNEPPDKPTIEGPSSGNAGIEYEFKFCSEDPDEDDIYYCIDWGDSSNYTAPGDIFENLLKDYLFLRDTLRFIDIHSLNFLNE